MLKTFSLFALPLVVLACSDSANTTDDPQSMLPRVQSFESARAGLDLESTTHVSEVMKGENVGHVTVEELHWASFSDPLIAEMSDRLQELKSCSNSAGAFVDISDASSALADLRHELHAHQVAMVTTVDIITAQAVEMTFQARQGMLLQGKHSPKHLTAALARASGH